VRFDSPAHLQVWRDSGQYPAIHKAIAEMAISCVRGSRLVDLGCSYGLLGARIVAQAGLESGIGVDADGEVLAAARSAGVPLTFHEIKVTASTLPQLLAVVASAGCDVVVARRVLPELFGHDLPGGRIFATMLAGAGVKEVVLEGRVQAPGAVNALSSIDREVELLAGTFREVRRSGAVSYLVLR
jgi:SAM-dependent methyltransferase